MELRPYQKEALAAIAAAGAGRWLVQLATGMGKTVIFANIPPANDHAKTLILSHREELVHQPIKYFSDRKCGVEMGVVKASADDEVVSASVQTMVRRLDRWSPDCFDTVIVDEAHHAASDTYREILNHFTPRRVLGFTATPNRGDGRGLEGVFDDIIFQRDLRWGIENGYLSRIVCKRVNIGYDLAGVASRMGDYATKDLDRAVNVDKCNDAIAEAVKNVADKPVLIFAVNVAHAEAIAAKIPGAKALSASSADRAEVVEAFKRGEVPVLVNCALFTEGTDLPNVKTVIIARPTKSNALYVQMVGRGTRLYSGKDHCLLIDCVGVSKQPICTAPSLIGEDLDGVPMELREEIEGDLLADIPGIVERASDTPQSWINNINIVDLWAKESGYNLRDVNYQRHPSGALQIAFPDSDKNLFWIAISPVDLSGKATLRTSSGAVVTAMAQQCYDKAYVLLRDNYNDCGALWRASAVRRWGSSPATEKQIAFMQKLAKRKKVNVSGIMNGLTKMGAGSVITRLQNGK